MTQPRVSVIILNWNGLKDTVECLESLQKSRCDGSEIIVVDNGSTCDEAAVLSARFGDFIRVIRNRTNQGFAEGCNIGIRDAFRRGTPDYVLLLNNDTVVDPDLLPLLISACEGDPSIGIAGPEVYFHHDPGAIQSVGGRINWWNGLASLLSTSQVNPGQLDRMADVDWVSGCALLARTSMIKQVGMLYAPYFAYFEEVDWCVRCRKSGYRVVHVPGARVWHKNPGSPEIGPSSSRYIYYMTRNRILFMRRNARWLRFIVFLAQLPVTQSLPFTVASVTIHRRNRSLLAPYYRGLRDGLLLSLPGRARAAHLRHGPEGGPSR